MLKETLFSLLMFIQWGVVDGGLGVYKGLGMETLQKKVQYKDAPMTMAMYKYLKTPKAPGTHYRSIDEQFTKIALQYVPIGTPTNEALNTFTKNRFKCGGPFEKKHNLENDEEYGCSLHNIAGRSFWVSSSTGFWIDVREGKVSGIRGSYGTYGP